jgi:hypothetical protein
MEIRGRELVHNMLLHSAKLIDEDESNIAVRKLLASIGYDSTVGPLEATNARESSEDVTPLLPELFVRTRQESSGGASATAQQSPCVALQLIRDNDCFWCALPSADAVVPWFQCVDSNRSLHQGRSQNLFDCM